MHAVRAHVANELRIAKRVIDEERVRHEQHLMNAKAKFDCFRTELHQNLQQFDAQGVEVTDVDDQGIKLKQSR